MLITSPSHVFAAENNLETTACGEQYRVAEVLELRETNADTYLLSDGTYECVVYAEDKYYQEQSGELVEIDNTIVPAEYKSRTESYKYTNAASSAKVYFSDVTPAILISSGENELAFSLVGANTATVAVGAKGNSYDFEDFELQSDNCLTYADALNGTDLVYSVNSGYLKEYLILSNATAPTEFQFEFDTHDCVIKENDAGTLDVYNTAGDLAFKFGSLFAVDSAGNYTEDLKYEITAEAESRTVVKVALDSAYMNNPSRVFPVLIDPSIMITGEDCTYDTCVDQEYPSSNYYLSENLWTGGALGTNAMRTYIKFDLPTYISSTQISSSYLRIRKREHAAPAVNAYRVTSSWRSSEITWNNKPSFTTTGATETITYDTDSWYKLNVTTLVKNWINGTYPNYGMVLKEPFESSSSQKTKFYSSDAASPNKPELHINYIQLKDACLVGVTSSGHDHSSCLSSSRTHLLNCNMRNVYTHTGEFSIADIRTYLDDNENQMFLSRSHGSVLYSSSGSQIGTCLILNDVDSSRFRSTLGFSSLELSNMTLVVFVACYTGKGGETGPNLVYEATNHGARTAVGFPQDILCSSANQWTVMFCEKMKNGASVSNACSFLGNLSMFNGTGLENPVITGNINTTLT